MISQPAVTALEQLWRKFAKYPGEKNQELDVSLNLPVVIGCTAETQPYIMLLPHEHPHPLIGLEAIDVRVGTRVSPIGENWSLTFVLQDWSLLHAFAEICLAFVERIHTSKSSKEALHEIYSTIDQWQRLLKTLRQSNRLSILRGVCGELIAAIEIRKITGKPIESICKAWSGPYSMPQDYSFDSENRYWEIKTIHNSAKQILISSPEQLNTLNKHINLITVILDTPNEDAEDRLVSLPQIIETLRQLSNNPSLISECVENGLTNLDINPYSDMSKHTMFAVGRVTTYSISKDFPKITTSVVPSGVTGLTYAIERSLISPFTTNVDERVLSTKTED